MNFKKITLALCCLFSTESIRPADYTPLEKIAFGVAIAGVASGGYYATQMNEQYSRLGKKPDARMRLTKSFLASIAVFGIDYLLSEKSMARDIGKVLACGLAFCATTQTVANIVRPMPLGGILTDPADENTGEETQADSGAFYRGIITYFTLRKIVKVLTK